jgi:hypothetical protein
LLRGPREGTIEHCHLRLAQGDHTGGAQSLSPAADSETLRLIDELAPVQYRVKPLLEAALVGSAILLATLTTSYFIYLRALNAQEGEIRQGLLRTAHVAAAIIDPAVHKSFSAPEQESSEVYQRNLAPLVAMKASDPQIAYLYTAIRKPDGKIYFVYDVTPTPDNVCAKNGDGTLIEVNDCVVDDSVQLLEYYESQAENAAILKAFDTQRDTTSDEAYTDDYCTCISGYVPLLDQAGEFYGVLGMDIDISDYSARLKPIKRATNRALVTGFFIAFITASVVWFLRNFIGILNRRRSVMFEQLKRAARNGQTPRGGS